MTSQAAECLLSVRIALVGGCFLAHGAAVCAKVYILTYQYFDCTYEFYVDGPTALAAGRLRAAALSHTVAPSASIHMKVNIP